MPSERLKIEVVGTGGGSSRGPRCVVAIFHTLARSEFVDFPGVGCLGAAGERTAQADHASHLVGQALGELARIDAAQTPADQAELAPAVALVEFLEPLQHVVLDARPQSEVAALPPAMHRVALRLEEAAQGLGGEIAGQEAGKHEHR